MKKKIILLAMYDFGSLSIRLLHSILKKEEVNLRTVFFKKLKDSNMNPPTEREIELLIKSIKEFEPDLIGISVTSPFFDIACDLIKKIRSKYRCLILLGGVHATLCPEECIKVADIVCIGEGERTIAELIKKIKEKDLTKIKNLWIKKANKIYKNSLRPLVSDLDKLPFIAYNDENMLFIEKNYITSKDPLLNSNVYVTLASRNCIFNCSFCIHSVLKEKYKNLKTYRRERSVKNFVEELSIAKRRLKNINFITLVEDIFPFDPSWINLFSKYYNKKVGLPFYCSIYPTLISDDAIKNLASVGLRIAEVGVQSGSEEIRKNVFHRYHSNTVLIDLSKKLSKYGVKGRYDIIIDNPFETEKDKKSTIDLFLNICRPFELAIHSLVYFPNLPITNMALSNNLITKKEINPKKVFKQWKLTFKYERKKEDIFWSYLFYLISLNVLPKNIIRSFSTNSNFFKKHIGFIKITFGMCYYISKIKKNIDITLKVLPYISKGNFKLIFLKLNKMYKGKKIYTRVEF